MWETVIGLEVHIQLATRSKIFSGSSTAYGAEPNTQASNIDLGMPGVLPVLNQEAVNMAIKFGLSVNAKIDQSSVFSRKNYFYPDLPKGYQISQDSRPIVNGGKVEITREDGSTFIVNLERAHLEEDAGKSLHEDFHGLTGVDLNRAGTPLLEIVSLPDMRCAKDAVAYLKAIHGLVKYLEICDGNMQEGSFRADVNVSVNKPGEPLGTRCEVKNLNSFRFVEKAIEVESQRQIDLIESGGTVTQQTRLYNPDTNTTKAMRSKENAHDYRYFPDPDLLPVPVEESLINDIADSLPELPWEKRDRYMKVYDLSQYDASLLAGDKSTADYFESTLSQTNASPKMVTNWLMGEMAAALNKDNIEIEHAPITSNSLAQLLNRIHDNTISGKIAKSVFEAMWANEGSADEIIEGKGLKQITDTNEISAIIKGILDKHPSQVEAYLGGQEKLFGFFVGQVMKATGGKANPAQVNQLLKDILKNN